MAGQQRIVAAVALYPGFNLLDAAVPLHALSTIDSAVFTIIPIAMKAGLVTLRSSLHAEIDSCPIGSQRTGNPAVG